MKHENEAEPVCQASVFDVCFRWISGFKTLVEYAPCNGGSMDFGGPIVNSEWAQESLDHGQWPIFRNTQSPGDLHRRVGDTINRL